jgi:hypothetical protein
MLVSIMTYSPPRPATTPGVLTDSVLWQKSPAGTRQTDGKNLVWFGEIEQKLAKLSMPTFLTVVPLDYFMAGSKSRSRRAKMTL